MPAELRVIMVSEGADDQPAPPHALQPPPLSYQPSYQPPPMPAVPAALQPPAPQPPKKAQTLSQTEWDELEKKYPGARAFGQKIGSIAPPRRDEEREPAKQEYGVQKPTEFTQQQWDNLGKWFPGKREQLVAAGEALPPSQSKPGADVAEEANDRLEKWKRAQAVKQSMQAQSEEYAKATAPKAEKEPEPFDPAKAAAAQLEREGQKRAVDIEMRKQSPEYREQAEREDAYAENAKAIRELTETARKEKIALEQMTEAERIEYLAIKESTRQREARAVQERAEQMRLEREGHPVEAVPDARPLHDEESYRRQINESLANKERAKRLQELRREMDPDFAKEQQAHELNKQASLLADGGAAIGGTIGRMMGIASQVMGSNIGQQMMGSAFGKNQSGAQQPARQGGGPPPPGGNIPNAERIAPAAQGAGQMGVQGMEGMVAAGAEMMPLVGAAMAAVQVVKEKMKEIAESNRQVARGTVNTAKDIGAMDADASMRILTRGFDAVADKSAELVPVMGMLTPASKEFVHGVDEMRGVIKQLTERFSQYNGPLAEQRARQEVAEMMRDMNRAERTGPRLERANESRFNMEQRLQDTLDRFLPPILKVATTFMDGTTYWLDKLDKTLLMILRGIDGMLAAVQPGENNWLPGTQQIRNSIQGIRDLIAEMRDTNPNMNGMAAFDRFLDGGWSDNGNGFAPPAIPGFAMPQAVAPPAPL